MMHASIALRLLFGVSTALAAVQLLLYQQGLLDTLKVTINSLVQVLRRRDESHFGISQIFRQFW